MGVIDFKNGSQIRSSKSFYSILLLFVLVVVMIVLPLDRAAPQEVTNEKTIVFIGDSLTEGYGVKKDEAFPEIAGRVLRDRGHKVRIINGGISGSVSADADRRLKWFLKSKPKVVVLALGSNDALKGTPVEVIKRNLASAIDFAKANGVKVLLCGNRVFENFGAEYTKAFAKIYSELAREKKVALLPFLLESVALKQELNQSDQKHPNAKGHELLGKDVARELEKLL